MRIGLAVVVSGPAASGKSTLAAAIGELAGARLLSSDLVRKELLGLAPTARAPTSAYEPAVNRRTYEALGRRAREAIDAGERVVVDATFRFRADRAAFLAALGAAELTWLVCRAPVEVLACRAVARMREAEYVSDAGPDVAVLQAEDWQPLGEVQGIELRTDRSREDVLAALRDCLDARLAGSSRRTTH